MAPPTRIEHSGDDYRVTARGEICRDEAKASRRSEVEHFEHASSFKN
jgi:hypothetical protein